MVMTRADANRAFLPEEVGNLIVRPVQRASIAFQTATDVPVEVGTFRIPIVAEDPAAEWVAEGEEITPSDASLDEEVVTPAKVAGLTVITRELAEDSSPAAAQLVGLGIARDIARQIDAAFFGNLPDPAPPGLGALTGVQTVDAGEAWTNLDPFAEAISKAEAAGATLTAFVTSPADALALAELKEQTGSNKPLLTPDPTMPTRRMIQGVPLYVSPAVSTGTVWGYDKALIHIIRREDVTLAVDYSAYFSSDRVGVRVTMRVGFGFPHKTGIVKITLSE